MARKTPPQDPLSIATFTDHLRTHDKAPLTIRSYRQDLMDFERWFKETLGRRPEPQDITPLDLREYKLALVQVRRLSVATVNRRLSSMRVYFEWALERGVIAQNPITELRAMKQDRWGPRWLTRKQTFALVRATAERLQRAQFRALSATRIEASRDAAIVALLLHAGLRPGEVCDLRLDEIKLGARSGSVRVHAGKGGRSREVPLNSDARKAIRSWIEVRPETESDRVLVGRRGGPLRDRGVRRVIGRLARASGLDNQGVSPQTLRHTFAKALVDSGVTLDRVALLLGHAHLSTTTRYTTPSGHDLEKAVEQIAWSDPER